MKKIITMMAILLMQQYHSTAQVSYGLTAGMAFSNYHLVEKPPLVPNTMRSNFESKTGFTAGGFVNIPLAKTLYFQPGVNYVQKGFTETFPETREKIIAYIYNIEVPLNFVYKTNNKKGDRFSENLWLGIGPTISMALSGKTTISYEGDTETTNIKFGNNEEEDDMKGMDIGANVMMGVQTQSGILIMANYNVGVSNLVPGGTKENRLSNHYWGIKIGYVFNKN
jgi:Outer membrane protein beta-barrel domain